MERKGKDLNTAITSSKHKPQVDVDVGKVGLHGDPEEDNETLSLLSPRRGGLSKNSSKPRLKVQWNDKDGKKLAEVVEFQPSDVSDSDDGDSDSCICVIL